VTGAESDPCSQLYAGPSPESDPEISQLTAYINNSIPEGTIKIYISLHSYGQYVLSPWGHTALEFPEHYPQMMHVAKGFSDALYRRYGTVFTYGSSATTLCKSTNFICINNFLINLGTFSRRSIWFGQGMGLCSEEHQNTLYHRAAR